MSGRGFVPWMAMLTLYCLTVVMLVTFFMVRCELAAGAVPRHEMSLSPGARASVPIGRSE